MKYFLILSLILLLLSSCGPDTFINKKLEATKIGECTGEVVPVRMEGNINGERYEFTYCLDEDFDTKNYSIIRSGDSLLVQFPKPTKKTALYKLTLDVEAQPAYRHIKLGEQTVEIHPTDKF